jgi:hypothetical protein
MCRSLVLGTGKIVFERELASSGALPAPPNVEIRRPPAGEYSLPETARHRETGKPLSRKCPEALEVQ